MPNSFSPRINLFVLGAAKSGTTSIHYALNQHPDVFMSTPKEPFFFEAEYERGCKYYIDKYFQGWSGQPIAGEARHRNLYLPFVPDRIAQTCPNAKFVVIARHPVDRAYSHWWHWYARGVERKNFSEIVQENLLRLEHGPFFDSRKEILLYQETLDMATGYSPYPSYIDSGYYAQQIDRYKERFGSNCIHILLFDDLVADSVNTINEMFRFLDLSTPKRLDTRPQNTAMSRLGVMIFVLLRKTRGKNLVPFAIRDRISYAVRSVFTAHKSMPPMDAELRQKLLSHFESHNQEFEYLLGRKLPEWRR